MSKQRCSSGSRMQLPKSNSTGTSAVETLRHFPSVGLRLVEMWTADLSWIWHSKLPPCLVCRSQKNWNQYIIHTTVEDHNLAQKKLTAVEVDKIGEEWLIVQIAIQFVEPKCSIASSQFPMHHIHFKFWADLNWRHQFPRADKLPHVLHVPWNRIPWRPMLSIPTALGSLTLRALRSTPQRASWSKSVKRKPCKVGGVTNDANPIATVVMNSSKDSSQNSMIKARRDTRPAGWDEP